MDHRDKKIRKIASLPPEGRARLEQLYRRELALKRTRHVYHWLDKSPFTNADKALNVAGMMLMAVSLISLWLLWIDASGHARAIVLIIGVNGGAYAAALVGLSVYRLIKRIAKAAA